MSYSMSKTNCCVVGCTNYHSKTSGNNISFYNFPSEKRWPGRCEKWTAAVNRQGTDGKLWIPKKHSRICSEHFVGGKKVDDSQHPSFIPSIFPNIYRKRPINQDLYQARYDRSKKRSALADVPCNSESQDVETILTKEFSTQTEPKFVGLEDAQSGVPCLEFWFCSTNSCSVSCQVDISVRAEMSEKEPSYKSFKSTGTVGENISKNVFSGFQSVQNDQQMKSLCGVSMQIFFFLLNYLVPKQGKVSTEDRLMVLLMKLKTGMSFIAISVLFGVSRQTISRIFISELSELIEKCSSFIYWPSREDIRTLMPEAFSNYPNLRAIIDCTEFLCERPSRVDEQVWIYSSYKSNYTFKYLIAITPQGFISFISGGFGGRATDAYITANCGLLDLLEKGDQVMADKGFPQIECHLLERSVSLIMPPFAYNPQFTEEECVITYEIAKVRIHVERCISRIRVFRILNKLSHSLMPYVDSIVHMCAILVNLQPPIIKISDFDNDEDYLENDI